MTKPTKPIMPMPEWFRLINPKAMVSAKELASLLGYKNVKTLHAVIRHDTIPDASRMSVGINAIQRLPVASDNYTDYNRRDNYCRPQKLKVYWTVAEAREIYAKRVKEYTDYVAKHGED